MAVSSAKSGGKRPGGGRIDLGLGALATGGAADASAPSPGGDHVPAAGENPPPASPAQPVSEFETLERSGRWSELGALCERRMRDSDGQDLEARLWWVRGQLGSGGVPAGILTAPLDSASRDLLTQITRNAAALNGSRDRLVRVATDLLSDLSGELARQGDDPTALTLLERSWRLDRRAEGSLRGYLARLLGRPRPPEGRRFEAARIFRARAEALAAELGVESSGPTRVGGGEGGRNREVTPPATEREVAPKSRRSLGAAVTLLLLIGGLAWVTTQRFLSSEGDDVALATAPLYSPEVPAVVKNPPIERHTRFSHLDALIYDIDRGSGGGSAATTSSPPVTTSGERESAAAPAEGADPRPAGDAPPKQMVAAVSAPASREVVDTSGPAEGPEIERARQQRDEGRDRERDVSEILFGEPPPKLGPLAGTQIEGLPVERFRGEQRFTIMVRTKVVPRPSFQSASVAELQAGDRVQADARVGDFLKIRSKGGQVGYILAQNARPTGEAVAAGPVARSR